MKDLSNHEEPIFSNGQEEIQVCPTKFKMACIQRSLRQKLGIDENTLLINGFKIVARSKYFTLYQ